MPIVVPIECATVICVPWVKKLMAGMENNSAKMMFIKIQKSVASKNRYAMGWFSFSTFKTERFQL